MQIGDLKKLSLTDYPGKLSCVVFLLGCNYRCPWCYAKDFVSSEDTKEDPRNQKIKENIFFNFLKEKRGLLEGVVLTGGEPTVHNDLPDFAKKIKDIGYSIKLDTNGSNPNLLKFLIKERLIDYVSMDVKAPKEKYMQTIGFSGCSSYYLLDKIEQSMNTLKQERIEYEFQTTVVPGVLKKEDILKITRWIAPAESYFLREFKPDNTLDEKFQESKPYPKEYLLKIQKAVSPFFGTCQLR